MARPQAPDYAQRREAIMRIAAELYAKHGFHATAVSAITAACNTSKSLLYHYFPSKEDLLFEVMTSYVDTILEATQSTERADRSPEENLLALAKVMMAHYKGAHHYHKVLLYELDSLPTAQRSEIVGRQRRILDVVDRQLLRLGPTKSKGERRAATMLFMGAMNWTHTWFDPAGELSSDALAATATKMLVRSISG